MKINHGGSHSRVRRYSECLGVPRRSAEGDRCGDFIITRRLAWSAREWNVNIMIALVLTFLPNTILF